MAHLIVSAVAVCTAACGGTAVTELGGPDPARCQVSLTADGRVVPADGGSVTVSVESARDCTWNATTDVSWATLSTTSGQGAGSIRVTVAASQQGTIRTAAIAVNNQRFELSQEARPCRFTLSSSEADVGAPGGRVSVAMTTPDGCSWRASTPAGWISVPASPRIGSGTMEMEVAANEGPQREGIIVIGDQRFTVTQSAAGTPAPNPPACAPVVQPSVLDVPAAAATQMIRIEVAAGCAWTAASNAPWLTITSQAAGQGATTVRVGIAQNTGAARTGTVTIAGQQVTIRQAEPTPTPQPCTYAIDPPLRAFPTSGGEGIVQVATRDGCEWTAASNANWVTVTVARGTGSGEARYRVQESSSTQARSATVTIAGRAHTVTQAAVAPACTFSLDPASASVDAGGGERRFKVITQAGCAWSAAEDANWLSTTRASGSGPGEVIYSVQANPATEPRSTAITVAGQAHAVTQAAAAPACTYSLNPPSHTVAAAGGEARFSVITQGGCAWSTSTDAGWLSVSSGAGPGPGDVIYTVQPNTITEPRSAIITVAGQSHTVMQAAAAPTCTYSLNPPSQSVPADGGGARFTVTTQAGCTWSASSGGAAWISITAGNGSGSGDVIYTVQANTAPDQRSAAIVVGGQSHTVTQAAAVPVCAYSLSPASSNVEAAGGEGRFTVLTSAGCTWAATTGTAWISIAAGVGTGQGDVVYTVQANTTTDQRSGAIVVAGQSHAVTQAGEPPPTPSPSPSPSPSP